MISAPTTSRTDSAPTQLVKIDWTLGWRYESVLDGAGQERLVRIPLTPAEALHPKEGYIMPMGTGHDHISDDLSDMFRAFCEDQPDMAVFRDLIFEWDNPDVEPYTPDIAVVPNVRDRDLDRGQFVVSKEGTRPCLIIEVVSTNSRTADRVTKVRDYARVGVQEYVYIDKRKRKRTPFCEVAGFRLEDGVYVPIAPDEDGAIYLATLDVRIGVEDGKVWLEDAKTGQDLLNHLETVRARRAAEIALEYAELARQEAEAAQRAAEARANEEVNARREAEARAAAAEAQLAQLQALLRAQQSNDNR